MPVAAEGVRLAVPSVQSSALCTDPDNVVNCFGDWLVAGGGTAAGDRLVIGDVELGQFDGHVATLRFGQELVRPPDRANGSVHGVSVLGEVEGGGAADAGVGTGHDGDGGVGHAETLGGGPGRFSGRRHAGDTCA